ncbi:two-component sensor histidine kinase [Taibaiella sp. KBW10]|uniref:sensor histidine kinase n=1 Tax=Taibaiella sp. KBW10 TaxID=2153357 RepID=UPI000F5B65D1|nr:ATP-binding protein [Taibaiella sp. KBW10]RQO30502.1 two-component sensor histidine kinase [Taibaiella sp. KBW10]
MKFVNFLYIFIFLYTIAALSFWGHSLNVQSQTIYEYEQRELRNSVDPVINSVQYKIGENAIQERLHTRNRQYIGEGITFLVIILIGAGVVYTALHRTQSLSKQQHNFMLSITHELKSPIAAIKLNLETIHKRKLTETQLHTLLSRSIKETNRLNDLCNNLLLASQLESTRFKSALDRISLTSIVKEELEQYIDRNSHSFLLDIKQDSFILGDKVLWKLVVSNLIENACKYSPPDALVTVKLNKTDDQQWVLQVADQGQGIADEEKKKIFQKFYRVGSEESRNTKGTGLGLFITAQIVDRHKGSIVVRDNEPKGSIFEITIAAE